MQGRIESSGDIRITESGNNQDELNVTIHDMEFGRRNVGIWGTAFNIFKCFVGIGLLALPSAFHHVKMGTINFYTFLDRDYWWSYRHNLDWSNKLFYNDDASQL